MGGRHRLQAWPIRACKHAMNRGVNTLETQFQEVVSVNLGDQGHHRPEGLPTLAQVRAGMAADLSDAMMALQRGSTEHGTRLLQQALSRGLDAAVLPDAYSNLGTAMWMLGRSNEASAAHRTALALRPHFGLASFNFAVQLAERGRRDEAEELYRRAIHFAPHMESAYNNLGNLLSRSREAEATEAYRGSIRASPVHAQAYNNLGNMIKGSKDGSDAEAARCAARLPCPLGPWARGCGISQQEPGLRAGSLFPPPHLPQALLPLPLRLPDLDAAPPRHATASCRASPRTRSAGGPAAARR